MTVFPIYMGVIPPDDLRKIWDDSIPHIYGGDPSIRVFEF